MIISHAPFRISFAGGGSDIAAYYRKQKGAVISTTINKYVYISIHPYFDRAQTLLKYSSNELINDIEKIQHPIFREAIKELWPQGGLEIVSTSDIPSGTGLGSSSTFSSALYIALYAYKGVYISKEKLSMKVCELEIEKLKEPIGKQDQYASCYGGLNFIEFNPDEKVIVTPLILPKETLLKLENNLLLFYTGEQRNTRDILSDQVQQITYDNKKTDNLSKMVELAYTMRDQLLTDDLNGFANSMHKGWELKRTLSGKISNSKIDKYYERALEYGALGGKLLGAGGGGFLLLYCEEKNHERLRKALFDCHELPFSFDWHGASIIYVGEKDIEQGFFSS
jgi:D-glycero-alpha-D-manno-heptose-7-phosphate kinase